MQDLNAEEVEEAEVKVVVEEEELQREAEAVNGAEVA